MNEVAKRDTGRTAVVARPKGVDQMLAERQVLLDVMDKLMQKDKHYGKIPGTPKPTLYKPGSELILSAFRIAVDPIVEDLSNADEIRYRVTCRGVHMETGIVVGSGVGEASTSEERYKWRASVCDEEFQATDETHRRIKYKKGYDGGAVQTLVQVRTQPADLANTVLKMAKKRAQIDMTLTATAASDVFTQDLEDLPTGLDPDAVADDKSSTGKPQTTAPQARSGSGGAGSSKASNAQIGLLKARCNDGNVSVADLIGHFGLESLDDMPKGKVDAALNFIKSGGNA